MEDREGVPYPASIPLRFADREREQITKYLARNGTEIEDLNRRSITVAASLSFYDGRIRALAHMVKVHHAQGPFSCALSAEEHKIKSVRGESVSRRPKKVRDLPSLPGGSVVTVIGPRGSDDTLHDVKRQLDDVSGCGTYSIRHQRTAMAGPRAVHELAELIRDARRDSGLVLLYRGGGSEVDLWPFWTADVAGAVSSNQPGAPVLIALGHTNDKTLADAYAWRSFEVPRALATAFGRAYGSAQRAFRPGASPGSGADGIARLRAKSAERDSSIEQLTAELGQKKRELVKAQREAKSNGREARSALGTAWAHAAHRDLLRHSSALQVLSALSVLSGIGIAASVGLGAPLWLLTMLLPCAAVLLVAKWVARAVRRTCESARQQIVAAGFPDPRRAPRPLTQLLRKEQRAPPRCGATAALLRRRAPAARRGRCTASAAGSERCRRAAP